MEVLFGYLIVGTVLALARLGYSYSTNGRVKWVEVYSYTPFIILFWPLIIFILVTMLVERK